MPELLFKLNILFEIKPNLKLFFFEVGGHLFFKKPCYLREFLLEVRNPLSRTRGEKSSPKYQRGRGLSSGCRWPGTILSGPVGPDRNPVTTLDIIYPTLRTFFLASIFQPSAHHHTQVPGCSIWVLNPGLMMLSGNYGRESSGGESCRSHHLTWV